MNKRVLFIGYDYLDANMVGVRMNKIKRWSIVPDRESPWHGPALKLGRRLLKAEKFSAHKAVFRRAALPDRAAG